MLDYLKKMEAELRARPKVPDMLFMTRKTWMIAAKQAIKDGVPVEYRPYMQARRFRFIGGIPVRIWEGVEENKAYGFNAPKFPFEISSRPIRW